MTAMTHRDLESLIVIGVFIVWLVAYSWAKRKEWL